MRAATLFSLGEALQRYNDVTIRFDGGPSIPRGLGGRAMGKVWQATTRIVVASEDKRTELIAASGLDADAVTVSKVRPLPRRLAKQGWALAEGDELRAGVSALVRERGQSRPAPPTGRSAVSSPAPRPCRVRRWRVTFRPGRWRRCSMSSRRRRASSVGVCSHRARELDRRGFGRHRRRGRSEKGQLGFRTASPN